MAFQSFPINRFGGLDLRADPQEVGAEGAVDLLNVDVDQPGRLRTRDGFATFNATALAGTPIAVIPSANNDGELLVLSNAGGSTFLERLSVSGAVASVGNWGANDFLSSWATLGTPTANSTFLAVVSALGNPNTMRVYNGSTVTTLAAKPSHCAVTPTSNRLVLGGFVNAADSPTGANGSRSTVFFSDAGAPTTWTASNFVHLRPGDGEVITGMAAWQDLVFVFKQTNCFVFYGESQDTTGGAVFNYRRIPLPAKIRVPSSAVPLFVNGTSRDVSASAPDGVYFATDKGIFRTAGGLPQNISQAVWPLFSGDASIVSPPRLTDGVPLLSSVGDRLICRYIFGTSTPNAHELVFNRSTGEWTIWQLDAASTAPTFWFSGFGPSAYVAGQTSVGYAAEAVFFAKGANVVAMRPGTATDQGAGISWRYQSGWYDLGVQGVKTTRWTRLWGSGAPTVSVFTDMGSSDSRAAAVTLGTDPAVAEGYHLGAYQGQLFSHKLSGSSAVTIHRLQHDVAGVRP